MREKDIGTTGPIIYEQTKGEYGSHVAGRVWHVVTVQDMGTVTYGDKDVTRIDCKEGTESTCHNSNSRLQLEQSAVTSERQNLFLLQVGISYSAMGND